MDSLLGKDVLTVYIVGFEVESRIGSAICKYNREVAWHSISTVGSKEVLCQLLGASTLANKKTYLTTLDTA